MIGSDTHDFRNIGVRRIVDAWSESLGGGFDLAYEYLKSLIQLENSPGQVTEMVKLFQTSAVLDELQHKLFCGRLEERGVLSLEKDEERLVIALSTIPECELDKAFLAQRLERFAGIDAERIYSMLPCDDFRHAMQRGRKWRGPRESVLQDKDEAIILLNHFFYNHRETHVL